MCQQPPRRFFGLFCAHQWEEIDRYKKVGAESGRWAGVIIELRCKHCGDVTWRKSGV